MHNNSLFIVIEGLDGSGKTTVSKHLVNCLASVFENKVKQTFEPHDASCGGLYIRQVLEKKIRQFSPEALTYAFAANRLDHCDREIIPWLEKEDRIIICDRYYLSSLVYQTNENHSLDYVMEVNQFAKKPDAIFFFNVSNEVCYQRMQHRNKPQELFERDLSETREKYFSAIDFLKNTRDENIIEIDANGSVQEVFNQLIEQIILLKKETWTDEECSKLRGFQIQTEKTTEIKNKALNKDEDLFANFNPSSSLSEIKSQFITLNHLHQAALIVSVLERKGFSIGSGISSIEQTAFELSYTLPGDILQQGALLILDSPLQYGTILESVSVIEPMIHFLLVYVPGDTEAVNTHFERELIQYSNGQNAIFPSIKIITEKDIANDLFEVLK